MLSEWSGEMKTSDMIWELCNKKGISASELARRIGQSPQNFGKKLKRDTVTLDEMIEIARAVGVTYEQAFVLDNDEKIEIKSMKQKNLTI
jgi:transcriptional regulator with XRE-family HTH domain